METHHLDALLEALQQLSTMVVFLLIAATAAEYIVALTFLCDLLLIIVTFFGMRVIAQHQMLRDMGTEKSLRPPYTRAQCRRLLRTFALGLAAERGRLEPDRAVRRSLSSAP